MKNTMNYQLHLYHKSKYKNIVGGAISRIMKVQLRERPN